MSGQSYCNSPIVSWSAAEKTARLPILTCLSDLLFIWSAIRLILTRHRSLHRRPSGWGSVLPCVKSEVLPKGLRRMESV